MPPTGCTRPFASDHAAANLDRGRRLAGWVKLLGITATVASAPLVRVGGRYTWVGAMLTGRKNRKKYP